ncbi:RHS repeat-associated core domain-containing protein, partial [Paraflavitalea sp. sgz302555]
GKSYYNLNGGTISGTTTAPTTLALLTSFASTNAMSSKGVSGTALNSITQLTSGITSLLGTQPAQTSSTPKAFINWILFDERFNYTGGGYDRVGSSGTVKNHNSSTIPSIVVPKNGYIYVYCSNESNINVFFDNLQIIHSRGPIVEETHYYPFGLTMAAVSSKSVSFGAPTNRLKYNGKEEQRQEFSDGAGLEWLDYGARMYDQQIGRWNHIDPLSEQYRRWSPYNYAVNNPIRFIDPDGMGVTDVKISGKAISTQDAFDQLQASVQGQLTLSRDNNGNVSYSINKDASGNNVTLSNDAKQLVAAIDDHSIQIEVRADRNASYTSNNLLLVGGAMMGSTVTQNTTTNPSGQTVPIVNAVQEVNPTVLGKADTHFQTPGKFMLHEVTEAYQGALIAQAQNKSLAPTTDPQDPVYLAAHGAAVTQPGTIIEQPIDRTGANITGMFPGLIAGYRYFAVGANNNMTEIHKIKWR